MPRKAATATAPPANPLIGVTPNKSIDPKKFNQILEYYNKRAATPTESLDGVCMYLWRTFPKIDVKAGQGGRRFSYIEKLNCVAEDGAVTLLPHSIQDYVRAKFGGGRFRASINDKGNEEGNQVAQSAFVIDDNEYPPIIDPSELVILDQETHAWAARMVSQGIYQRNQDGTFVLKSGNATDDPNSVVARLLERSMNTAPQAGPAADAIAMMRDTYKALLTDKSEAAGKSSGLDVNTLLVTLMQQNQQLMMKMFEIGRAPAAAVAPAATAPAAPTLELFDQFEQFAERIGLRAKSVPAPSFFDELKPYIPMMMPLLLRFMGPTGPMPPPGAAPPPGVPAAVAPPPDAPPGPQQIDVGQAFGNLVANALKLEHDGTQVAASIELMHSEDVYDQLRAMGKDNLTAALLRTPHADTFTKSGAAVAKILDEFIEYGAPENVQ